ncbi:MAG: hypothetical protein PHH24_03270 [Candidatus Moranbacteria bacterium]|jgi:hypothetical protein|nr:hypothetical protein [Candidatus Moranbacteria bacterium]MDD5652057.1 hypothetical protein [Candidatus Moranbacteria bacterium]MDX9855943.1 hypothetical protein [Candidatus Moranbacteria bacterium]
MASHKTKLIFFLFLVVTFLIISPLVIFYAMGYRFSMERGVFVYSGSITIKPFPREIEVLIDNEPVAKGIINFINYSYHIDGLLPGEYLLEVKADQYKSWGKKASVHSGVSTEFWNVFLIRENYSKTEYPTSFVNNFFISPDGKNIALVEGETSAEIKVLNVKKEKIEYVFPISGYIFSESEKENVEWSPREGHLSVPLIRDGKREYFIINIGNKEVLNLNETVKRDNIRQVRWSSAERNAVFYIHEDNLYKFDLDNINSEVLVAEDISGYDISPDGIYYFDKDSGLIYEKNNRGTNGGKQISSSPIENKDGDDFRMIVYDKNRIAVITQDKDFYLFNKSDDASGKAEKINKIKDGISGAHFSNDGKKIVFWNKNEIFVYFVRKWDTQPSREEGKMINIVHFSKEISNVSWFRDYEHVIFSVGNSVKIAELDHRSLRNIYDIFEHKKENSKVTYTARDDNIFFVDLNNSGNSGLFSVSLEEENAK